MAIGAASITRHGRRVRFYSAVGLVTALEQEKAQGKARRIAASLLRMDMVMFDELGSLPFSQAGGPLMFHLLSKLYERISVMITTKLNFGESSSVFRCSHSTSSCLSVQVRHRQRLGAEEASGRCRQGDAGAQQPAHDRTGRDRM
jgi:DNA replication protein DnaC